MPIGNAFDLAGYQVIYARAHFPIYFLNSTIVTLGSTTLILARGAMAAHALAEYRFRLNRFLILYFALGIMISIRLGSAGIVGMLSSLRLTNTIWGDARGLYRGRVTAHHLHHDPVHASDPERTQTGSAR